MPYNEITAQITVVCNLKYKLTCAQIEFKNSNLIVQAIPKQQ